MKSVARINSDYTLQGLREKVIYKSSSFAQVFKSFLPKQEKSEHLQVGAHFFPREDRRNKKRCVHSIDGNDEKNME